MKKEKLRLFYIEDSDIDQAVLESTIEHISLDYPDRKIEVRTLSILLEQTRDVSSDVQWADVVIFDYGGLCVNLGCDHHQLVDHWNRHLINLIREKPSKDWRCYSALDTFEEDDREELESLGVTFQFTC